MAHWVILWTATAHSLSTLMMAGIIWFLQIVHYPLLHQIGIPQFPNYMRKNGWRTAAVVIPVMCVEVGSACALLILPIASISLTVRIIGVVLVAFIWSSTVLIQWPIHRKLRHRFDEKLLCRLIRSNWIRTVGWSFRCVVAIDIIRQLGFF